MSKIDDSRGFLILALVAMTFVIDMLTPRGYAVWILYAFPLFQTQRGDSPFEAFPIQFLCMMLMALALPLKPPDGVPLVISILNRSFAAGAGIILAGLITMVKREKELIFREHNTFYTLAESSPDVIFIYDLAMRYRYINRSVQRYTGLPAGHYIGKTNREAGTPEYLCGLWEEEFRKVVASGKSRSFEFTYPLPEGDRYFRETNIPVISKDGTVEAVEGFAHDITQLKIFQKELEERVRERSRALFSSQRELEQSKRLSDIGTLAATVAHELRNPLGVIKTAAYNIKRKAREATISGQLENIDKKVAQSDEIINNLLFYARLKRPQYERVELYRLARECIDSFRKRFSDFDLIDDLGEIKGVYIQADPLQLTELINNLISNGRDAVRDKKGHVVVRGYREKSGVRLEFDDNGTGIASGELKKLFEPFYSTKSKGTGLGLTVVRQIAVIHNGSIEVLSEQGKGTRVRVLLPLTQG